MPWPALWLLISSSLRRTAENYRHAAVARPRSKAGALQWLRAAALPRAGVIKPPLTRMADHDATSETLDGKSDNIRPPDRVIAPADARDGDTRASQVRKQLCAQ
jgi:hypothetical protein